jgi:general secretion pathway protein B
MSYILDALKRADAERERGAVPGLHAHQLTTPAASGTARARQRLGLLVGAAVLLACAAVAVWFAQTAERDGRLAAVEPMVVKPALPIPAAAPVVAPSPTPVPALVAAPAPVLARVPKVPPAPTPKALVTELVPTTVPLLSELPEDSRRQIPALTISGAVYSKDAAQRLLLVNGQVVTQGALAAPELTLEEIGARSSVFSFRGTRFRLAH